MEVQIDISEENEKTQCIIDFLTKVTVERVDSKKYIVHFNGDLRKYNFKLQISDVIGFLLWHWFMNLEEKKALETQKQAKNEKLGYAT